MFDYIIAYLALNKFIDNFLCLTKKFHTLNYFPFASKLLCK